MRLFLLLSILLFLCCCSSLTCVSSSAARLHAFQQHHRAQQHMLQQDAGLQSQLLSIAERAQSKLRLHQQSHDEIKHEFITSLMELAQEHANMMMNISMIETKQIIYKCTCANGVHAVDAACTANMEKCVGCKAGYKLSGTKCIPNDYINVYTYPRVNPSTCWKAGTVCWDDMGENSCHLRCCSQNYVQATSGINAGKDVCTKPGPCWNKGTKCWDNDGQDSCKWRCCSHTWYHDDVRDYDVCDGPAPIAEAISGYDTKNPVDDQLRVTLFTTFRSCWTAGTKCWNNGGQDSCWERCCSKSYYHDPAKNSDVCAPIPADKKCYAQYTPCWNSLPVPQGNFYVEVRNNQKVYYPSCFQCCARVRNSDGGSRWPAWTEYYIGNGNHDSTSEATHWWDAFVAGAENVNPVQFIVDAARPVDSTRGKRGGNEIASNVASSMAEAGAKLGTKLAVKAAVQAMNAGLNTNPVTAGVGVVFSFFYGFFSKLTEPKWDLCD